MLKKMLIRPVKTTTFSELTHKNHAVTVWPFKNGDLSRKKTACLVP